MHAEYWKTGGKVIQRSRKKKLCERVGKLAQKCPDE